MSSDRDRTPHRCEGAYGGVAMAAVLCLGLTVALPLKAQELEWAKRAGGIGDEQGNHIATDSAGNSYLTGLFTGTATFGPGEVMRPRSPPLVARTSSSPDMMQLKRG